MSQLNKAKLAAIYTAYIAELEAKSEVVRLEYAEASLPARLRRLEDRNSELIGQTLGASQLMCRILNAMEDES